MCKTHIRNNINNETFIQNRSGYILAHRQFTKEGPIFPLLPCWWFWWKKWPRKFSSVEDAQSNFAKNKTNKQDIERVPEEPEIAESVMPLWRRGNPDRWLVMLGSWGFGFEKKETGGRWSCFLWLGQEAHGGGVVRTAAAIDACAKLRRGTDCGVVWRRFLAVWRSPDGWRSDSRAMRENHLRGAHYWEYKRAQNK